MIPTNFQLKRSIIGKPRSVRPIPERLLRVTTDKSVWISPRQSLESFRWITIDLRTMTHGHQKDRILDKNEPQKVSKKLIKNWVPRTSISYSLKLVNDPLFSELRKIIMSKHQSPTACVHPSYPLRINHEVFGRTKDERRTNERKSRLMRRRTTKRFAQ